MSSETTEPSLAPAERDRWIRPDVLADLAAGRYERAIDTCRRQPAHAGAVDLFFRHGLGLALYKRGRFEEAVEVFQAEPGASASARAQLALGTVLRDLGRVPEAIGAATRAIELDPERASAWLLRGRLHSLAGRPREAASDVTRALELDPARVAAWEHLAAACLSLGDLPGALDAFGGLIDRDPVRARRFAAVVRDLGRAEVLLESIAYGTRLKGVLGSIGDRLREMVGRVASLPGSGEVADLLAQAQFDQRRVHHDVVGYLDALEARPFRLELARVDRLVEDALLVAAPAVDGIAVERAIGAGLPELVCDPRRVQEAFLNLILNAVDATGPGGRLTISARAPSEDEVRVRFEDDGPGIDPAHVDRIFDFGFSTRPHGSGLGLWQARRRVEEHGGRIVVAGEKGRGAEFEIRLPVRPQPGPAVARFRPRPVLEEDLEELLHEP